MLLHKVSTNCTMGIPGCRGPTAPPVWVRPQWERCLCVWAEGQPELLVVISGTMRRHCAMSVEHTKWGASSPHASTTQVCAFSVTADQTNSWRWRGTLLSINSSTLFWKSFCDVTKGITNWSSYEASVGENSEATSFKLIVLPAQCCWDYYTKEI